MTLLQGARARRGDWLQTFFVIFFVFILIAGLFLLRSQAHARVTEKPNLEEDLRDVRATMVLLGLLRQPFPDADLNRDGSADQATLAEVIGANADARDDAAIQHRIERAIPEKTAFRVTIAYAKRTIIAQRAPDLLASVPKDQHSSVSLLLPCVSGDVTVTLDLVTLEDLVASGKATNEEISQMATALAPAGAP